MPTTLPLALSFLAGGSWLAGAKPSDQPPDLPSPQTYEDYPDLQADGEWWFYKLIDNQWPHDVFPSLSSSAFVELCSAPKAKFDLPQRGCPTDSVASCVANNTAYFTFWDAWAACGTFPECGVLMQWTDGKYYLRRHSDPASPISGAASMIYSCNANARRVQFMDLPDADYLLLDFSMPWCWHCKHFAVELAKVVRVLETPQAQSVARIATRAVDCENLRLQAVCEWAQADLFPKLLLAKREALLGKNHITAFHTPGVALLKHVEEASDVMAFLRQNVPGWSAADIPRPEARDPKEPLLHWMLPAEGLAEPAQAPLQDIVVGVAALLHKAFSLHHLGPSSEGALRDLLQLLCVAGPGATCRSSACKMRSYLDSPPGGGSLWREGHFDWKRIEQDNQWCGRPWPDFAKEGWQWCKGQSPGFRPYFCGLWMVFHSLLAGAEQAPPNALAALPKPPLLIIRSAAANFLDCKICDHSTFQGVPVRPQDVATPEAQMLWLWSAHNSATASVMQTERQLSPNSPLRIQWPTQAACPECVDDDGGFVRPQIAARLRKFYGGSFKDESQATAPPIAPPGTPAGMLRKPDEANICENCVIMKFASGEVGAFKWRGSFANLAGVGWGLAAAALAAVGLGAARRRGGPIAAAAPVEWQGRFRLIAAAPAE